VACAGTVRMKQMGRSAMTADERHGRDTGSDESRGRGPSHRRIILGEDR